MGGVTGSLLALLPARVHIETTLLEPIPSLQPFAYDVDGAKLVVCSYIDDIYVAARLPSSATLNVEAIF